MTLTFKIASYELIEQIAVITLNDPPANTISYDLLQQLEDVIFKLIFEENINGIVITGEGESFYSGGVNINMLHYSSNHFNSNFLLYAAEVLTFLESISAYKVAAINGNITGGGLELALITDSRFAAEGSYNIGFPEVRLGVIPGMGGTQRLARLVGPQKALEHIIQGEFMSPAEAHTMGLVDALFSPQTLREEALKYCQQQAAACREKAPLHIDLKAFHYCEISFAEGRADILLSGEVTTETELLQLLNELNRCILKFRLDKDSALVIINAQSLQLPDTSNAALADYLTMVTQRIESTPHLFIYCGDSSSLSATSTQLAFACDYRFSPQPADSTDLPAVVDVARYHGIDNAALFRPGDYATALQWSQRFVAPNGASKAIGYVKLSILKGSVTDIASGMMLERHLQEQLFTSLDGKEGMTSYLKKRSPVFKGE